MGVQVKRVRIIRSKEPTIDSDVVNQPVPPICSRQSRLDFGVRKIIGVRVGLVIGIRPVGVNDDVIAVVSSDAKMVPPIRRNGHVDLFAA